MLKRMDEGTLLRPDAAAAAASLRYVSDEQPGIRRLRAGKAFHYRDAKGKNISDARTLDRIAHLAIPPAWTDVWISPSDKGHIQATGRDAKGRKQYRYHERWSLLPRRSEILQPRRLCGRASRPCGRRSIRTFAAAACPMRKSSPRSSGCSTTP